MTFLRKGSVPFRNVSASYAGVHEDPEMEPGCIRPSALGVSGDDEATVPVPTTIPRTVAALTAIQVAIFIFIDEILFFYDEADFTVQKSRPSKLRTG